ncbi:MAG: alpha/beta hydrolase [Myxococcales bacterium]|nr:alpha/beta hydrolase [Myxococcales bacterium]
MTSPPPPRSRYLALPTGLTYHVLEWPHPTSETTVVLVHGFLDFAWGWRWVAQELARSFHVVAPDLRGHGDTDWIGAGGYYYFFDYLADLDALLPRLCRGNLILVGHSMGGSVASYWAGVRAGDPRRPQPAALALLEGLGPPEIAEEGAHAMPARVGRWIDQWQRARVEPSRALASLEDAMGRLMRHDPMLSAEHARELAERGTRVERGGLRWKHDPLHVTAGPIAFRRQVAGELWSKIACPVLVVDARESTLRLPDAELAARRAFFARCTHEVIEQAGHMMQRHQPAKVAELVTSLALATR